MEAAVIEEIAALRVDKKIKLFEVIGDLRVILTTSTKSAQCWLRRGKFRFGM